MSLIPSRIGCIGLLLLGSIVLSQNAWADKPDWAGEHGGKGKGKGAAERARGPVPTGHFGDQHRVAARDFYGEQFKSGRCPPGLAKKNNGCLPPGQARKWQMNRPLPRDVIYYEVPQQLVIKLGVPPSGYRYVRVAGDLLLIALGTALVVDAIQDLGR